MMTTVFLEIDDKEDRIIKEYAKAKHITVSELFTNSALERIEEEIAIDKKLSNEAMNHNPIDNQAVFCEEMLKDLGLIE